MSQTLATQHGGEPNPLDTTGLCLLSLDGGGVRGLSTLYILKGIMTRLNGQRREAGLPPVKPCEMFDLIGGTSTGGLIAIMLGRLEMDVDECITGYTKLMKAVFMEKSSKIPLSWRGKVKAQFDSKKLKAAVEEVIVDAGCSVTDAFNDGKNRGCRTFVCATAHETTSISRIRSYTHPEEGDIPATICEAALATSAATGFFDPVFIKARQFVDGALGANNPVTEVEGEASGIWSSGEGELKPLVKCFISIGTGNPGKKALEDNMFKFLSKSLVSIATETEKTEKMFIARWAKQYDEKRYFRFNVDQGLQDIGLAEYKEQGKMEAATDEYLGHQAQKFRVRDCVQNLQQKQKGTEIYFASRLKEHLNKPVESFTVQFSLPKASHVDHFVGRDEELDEINSGLQHDGSRKTVVVCGLGGMGKTQLALAYALRHRDEYSAVFWVNSKDVDTLKKSYVAALKRVYQNHKSLAYMNAIAEGGDRDEATEAFKQWLSSARNDRWLIIYDNYDTPKLDGNDQIGAFDIEDYFPEAYHGAILITTRSSQLRMGLLVTVKKLQNIEHSLEILSHASARKDLESNSDARKLAEELDGLPLALSTAGAYLYQVSPTSFADYIRLYKKSWLRLQQKTPRLLSYEDRALYSTWDISYEHVKQKSELAAKLLQLWAYFDNQDVWFELLREGSQDGPKWFSELTEDMIDFNDAVRVLCEYALIEADAMSKGESTESLGYSMHSCVHSWTMHVVNNGSDGSLAKLALRCVGLHVPKNDRPQYWVIQQRLLQHANRGRELISASLVGVENDESMLEALHKLGNLYADQSKLVEAEEMYRRTLEGKEKAFGPNHASTLDTINSFGVLYKEQGKLGKAEDMYQRALEGREKALGCNHMSTLDTVSNLGLLYIDQGKLDKAEEMYRRALEGREQVPGRNNYPEFNNLGILYRLQGKLDKAEEMFQRALEGKEKALGSDHPSTLETVNNLGNLYTNQGKLDKAEKMYWQALEGKETALGPNHKSTLMTANNLSILYAKQDKLDKAVETLQRVLGGREKALGRDHTSTLATVNRVGKLYMDQGKLDKAEEMYWRVLEGKEKTLGRNHPSTLDTINRLGNLCAEQGKLDKAEEMFQRALEGKEKALGHDHPSTLGTMTNLGNLYILYASQDKLEKAEEMFQRVLEGEEKTLGRNHMSTFATINRLANLYVNQGKLDKAEKMCWRALEGKETALERYHTSTFTTMNNIGSLYRDKGKLDKAEEMYQQALEGKEKSLGPDDESTLNTVHNLGSLYADQGKLDKAEEMFQRALIGKEKVHGRSHVSTLGTVNSLGNLYVKQGRLDKAEEMYWRALEGKEKALGPNHRLTLITVKNLGRLYLEQGKQDKAEEMYQRTPEGKREDT